jgi:hypothetical protein
MSYRKAVFAVCLRIGVAALASVVLVGAMSRSAVADTFVNVDSSVSGPMQLSVLGSSYVGGQWVFDLQAVNTSASPLTNVNWVQQFVWDETGAPSSIAALTWDNVGQDWISDIPSDTFALTSASSPYAVSYFPMSSGITLHSYAQSSPYVTPSASVNSSDSLPAVGLGNFSGSETKDFTIYCSANDFTPAVTGYFVAAVPEPSTLALFVAGGMGLVGYVWRRKRAT